MSPIFIGTIGGIATLILWGIGDWLTGKSSKKFPEYEVNLAVQVPGMIMLALLMIFSGETIPSARQFTDIILAGTCFSVAYIFFIRALATGSIGIVVPLGNIYPLITLVLTAVLVGTQFTAPQAAAMVAIVIGAALLAYDKNHHNVSLKVLHRETFLAMMAALLWGVGFYFIQKIIGVVPWQMIVGIDALYMGIFAIALLSVTTSLKTPQAWARSLIRNRMGSLAGIVLAVGAITLYVAADRAHDIIITTVIASGAPLVTSLLGAVVDHEKIGTIKRLGGIIAIGGIVTLNLI